MHLLEYPEECVRCRRGTNRAYSGVPLCIVCRMQEVKKALPAYRIRQPRPWWQIWRRI